MGRTRPALAARSRSTRPSWFTAWVEARIKATAEARVGVRVQVRVRVRLGLGVELGEAVLIEAIREGDAALLELRLDLGDPHACRVRTTTATAAAAAAGAARSRGRGSTTAAVPCTLVCHPLRTASRTWQPWELSQPEAQPEEGTEAEVAAVAVAEAS
eukprot:scaffold85453_cov54-Phaeocystis_antarctica.AAC.3